VGCGARAKAASPHPLSCLGEWDVCSCGAADWCGELAAMVRRSSPFSQRGCCLCRAVARLLATSLRRRSRTRPRRPSSASGFIAWNKRSERRLPWQAPALKGLKDVEAPHASWSKDRGYQPNHRDCRRNCPPVPRHNGIFAVAKHGDGPHRADRELARRSKGCVRSTRFPKGNQLKSLLSSSPARRIQGQR
jgi:hypothetical protein